VGGLVGHRWGDSTAKRGRKYPFRYILPVDACFAVANEWLPSNVRFVRLGSMVNSR
jgi:hypothetical protein